MKTNRPLNLNHRLTSLNVRKLLLWKAPIYLGKFKKGKTFLRRSVKHLDSINMFRYHKMDEDDFYDLTENIFKTGIVWRAYLFHIARPWEFPIADENVFNTFKTITKNEVPGNWREYLEYKNFFFKVAETAGIISAPIGKDKNVSSNIVRKLKKVDNAFFIFGKFLFDYSSNSNDK